jgi:hypothetical protein
MEKTFHPHAFALQKGIRSLRAGLYCSTTPKLISPAYHRRESMAKFAILITYTDMETDILPGFIGRAEKKYGERFSILRLDGGKWIVGNRLASAVTQIPPGEKLKVFISGHGFTGVQYITDNSGIRRQTVDDLASLLCTGLDHRCTCEYDYLSFRTNT